MSTGIHLPATGFILLLLYCKPRWNEADEENLFQKFWPWTWPCLDQSLIETVQKSNQFFRWLPWQFLIKHIIIQCSFHHRHGTYNSVWKCLSLKTVLFSFLLKLLSKLNRAYKHEQHLYSNEFTTSYFIVVSLPAAVCSNHVPMLNLITDIPERQFAQMQLSKNWHRQYSTAIWPSFSYILLISLSFQMSHLDSRFFLNITTVA